MRSLQLLLFNSNCLVSFSIDGEYVPKEGDEVTYRTITMPPRMEKKQACHVVITHLKPGVTHERWDSPLPKESEES